MFYKSLIVIYLVILFSQIFVCNRLRKEKTSDEESNTNPNSLETVFRSFTSGKTGMSNKEFLKFHKDCHLLDSHYTMTDVDINFAQIKNKGVKEISFEQFKEGLMLASKKKGVVYDDFVNNLCSVGGRVSLEKN